MNGVDVLESQVMPAAVGVQGDQVDSAGAEGVNWFAVDDLELLGGRLVEVSKEGEGTRDVVVLERRVDDDLGRRDGGQHGLGRCSRAHREGRQGADDHEDVQPDSTC